MVVLKTELVVEIEKGLWVYLLSLEGKDVGPMFLWFLVSMV